MFTSLRQDLTAKQKALYELAGLDEATFSFKVEPTHCEEVDLEVDLNQEEENESEFEMEFEAVEQDDEDTTIFVEEQIEEQLGEEMEAVEAVDEAETIIRIEKVYEKEMEDTHKIEMEEDGSASFDFFEEIVGVESEDQKYYESEYLKDEMQVLFVSIVTTYSRLFFF